MNETRYAQLCRLQREERQTAKALYGWNHPHNVARARGQGGESFYEHPMHCHPGRIGMVIEDREWLVHPRNRDVVKQLWALLLAAPRTISGNYGNLSTDQLDDVGVPDCLISHWRDVRYGADGSREEIIPGSIIARDLELLGLSHDAVMSGIVKQPVKRDASRPKVAKPSRPATPVEPLVIRRRGEGVARGG